jgi:hypothetical protein
MGLVLATAGYFAFRGDEEVLPTPTPVPTTEQTPVPSATPMPSATVAPTATPSSTPPPTPTLAAGRRAVPAPIDAVSVETQGTPSQYVVLATATLPNGCIMQYTQSVRREGNTFIVTVLNSEPTANVLCTTVFRTYQVRVTIGDALQSGQTYTVRVNDKSTTFRAR